MSVTYSDLTNTKFPDEIDNWDRFLDPTITTLSAITQYQAYYSKGDFVNANNIIAANPVLKQIIVNANSMNRIIDGLVAIQRFYHDDIQKYLVNIIQWRGEYSSAAKYSKYDQVTYLTHGEQEAYLCIKDAPIGTPPTDLSYWCSWTMRGAKGDSGTGLTPRGIYDPEAEYYENDMVSYNNIWWYATEDNTATTPSESGGTWVALLKFGADLLSFDHSGTSLTATTFQAALVELSERMVILAGLTLQASSFDSSSKTIKIANSAIKPNHIASIHFAADSIIPATKAGIRVTAYDGYLELKVNYIPSQDLSISSIVLKTNYVSGSNMVGTSNAQDYSFLNRTVQISLPASGWVGGAAPYKQTVSVEGLTENDNVELIRYIDSSSTNSAAVKAYNKAFGMIDDGETGNGTATFYCWVKKPATDLIVLLKGV